MTCTAANPTGSRHPAHQLHSTAVQELPEAGQRTSRRPRHRWPSGICLSRSAAAETAFCLSPTVRAVKLSSQKPETSWLFTSRSRQECGLLHVVQISAFATSALRIDPGRHSQTIKRIVMLCSDASAAVCFCSAVQAKSSSTVVTACLLLAHWLERAEQSYKAALAHTHRM